MNPMSYEQGFIPLDINPFLNSSARHLGRQPQMNTVITLMRKVRDDPAEDGATYERRAFLCRSFVVTVPPAGADGYADAVAAKNVGELVNALVSRALVVGFLGQVVQFRLDGRIAIWFSAHLAGRAEDLPAELRAVSYEDHQAPAGGLTDFGPLKPLWQTPAGGSVRHAVPIPDVNLVRMTDHPPIAVEIGDYTSRAQAWRSYDGEVISVIGIAGLDQSGDGFGDLEPERLVIFQWRDGRVEAMPEWKFRDGRFRPAMFTVEPWAGELR